MEIGVLSPSLRAKRSNPVALTRRSWIASSLSAPRNDGEAGFPAKPSTRPQRHRAERLQQMRVELAAHRFHDRKRLGVGVRQPVGALLHQCGVDIHDGDDAHDIADLIAAAGRWGIRCRRGIRDDAGSHPASPAESRPARQRVIAQPRMLADDAQFLVVEPAGLVQTASGMNALPTSCSRAARARRR